jgi:hypothetical protein
MSLNVKHSTPAKDADEMNKQWDAERKKKSEEESEAKAWDKGIWQNKVIVPDDVLRERERLAKLTPEERAFEPEAERYVNELIQQAFELSKREAEESLRVNPDDENAQSQLLRSQQYLRQIAKGTVERLTVNMHKPKSKGDRRTGVWARTKRGGWAIKVPVACVVGEIVNVRKKGGGSEPMRLTEKIQDGVFKGQRA